MEALYTIAPRLDEKPVYLRPHHMVCIQTYIGVDHVSGPEVNFAKSMRVTIENIQWGAPVILSYASDAICHGCLKKGCQAPRVPVAKQNEMRQRDVKAYELLRKVSHAAIELGVPFGTTRRTFTELRALYAQDAYREVCFGCGFRSLCANIASSGFQSVLLYRPLKEKPERHEVNGKRDLPALVAA